MHNAYLNIVHILCFRRTCTYIYSERSYWPVSSVGWMERIRQTTAYPTAHMQTHSTDDTAKEQQPTRWWWWWDDDVDDVDDRLCALPVCAWTTNTVPPQAVIERNELNSPMLGSAWPGNEFRNESYSAGHGRTVRVRTAEGSRSDRSQLIADAMHEQINWELTLRLFVAFLFLWINYLSIFPNYPVPT